MFSCDGEEYPEEFFNQFWDELKSYKPDYEDNKSHILCWKLENAKEIFNSFDDILKKYYEMNKERIKKEKIKKLKEEQMIYKINLIKNTNNINYESNKRSTKNS